MLPNSGLVGGVPVRGRGFGTRSLRPFPTQTILLFYDSNFNGITLNLRRCTKHLNTKASRVKEELCQHVLIQ